MPFVDETLPEMIRQMPKVELHVHLEGSIQPATLLKLAERHQVALPASCVEDLRRWYTFTDFAHFVEIYQTISNCIRTCDDIELIAREFLLGQAAQHILYSEVTFTAYTHSVKGLAFADQLAALARARRWAERELGVSMGLVIDISREREAAVGDQVARWVIGARENGGACENGGAQENGVVALGLGGPEIGNPPEKFTHAFEMAHRAGIPCVPHAGETEGPASIWGALNCLHACRIGHGVRCLEDPALVAELRARQIPLEVCPTSNVCLKVAPDIAHHPLPRLLEEGLYVTLNSDDPAMFNTTLTDEYLIAAEAFSLTADQIHTLVRNAARAALLPEAQRQALAARL